MKKSRFYFCLAALVFGLVSLAVPVRAASPSAYEFLDGDRVVLLGDTLIEREQTYGFWESRITARFPGRKILFRNLGWSADTVMGQSRVSFDWNKSEEEWFSRLKAQIAAFKPTVAILGYGMASSFDGEAGIPKFKGDLVKLMTAIQEISGDKPVRFIVLGPIQHENLGAPLPDPANHNQQLKLYTKALQDVINERKEFACRFIPLFDALPYSQKDGSTLPVTDNGIHLNEYGYYVAADALERGLGWSPVSWGVKIGSNGKVSDESTSLKISNMAKSADRVSFEATHDYTVTEILVSSNKAAPAATPVPTVRIEGLKPGKYTLKIGDVAIATHTEKEWAQGKPVHQGPAYDRALELRKTIQKKNELYFHRWRPQNETYLFGFRKYEQGQNAREIPMFDPLISEQEEKIAQLAKPVAYKYELVPEIEAKEAVATQSSARENKTANSKNTSSADEGQKKELPQFTIDPGFEVSLFAESPILAKPIQINFDPQGRLWVASSEVYPQIQPGQNASDKILILEDTNQDGKADKSTIFAEGLLIPTGIEPGDGGAYVGQSTELLHFKDTDGDGKADQKKIVLSGFGTEDTHHIVHTLRWGHDGQLYFNQSIYIHSHIETPHGVVRLNSGGILHLRPPTMELGVFLRGFINTWGHDFDKFGQSFVTDGAGHEGINYGVPGAMYVTYAGARRILGSVSPGSYPKFCGLEIVRSQHFPDDWQGNLVTCDFRAHRVVRFAINEQGSAYITKEMPDLLRTSDVTFRPIDVKLGPDGALYIADWSNPIIQHGEVDFRDPRRDHERGRIWRITAKGRPVAKHPNLVKASNRELLNELLSPNAYNQRQARRVLTERGNAIAADLAEWSKQQTAETALLEALWMHQSIDKVDSAILQKVVGAQDGRVRAAGARVLSFWHKRVPNASELLAKLAADEHPRVRLEAIRTLSQIPTAKSAELVLSTLDKASDRFLEYALWLSINDLAKPWTEAVRSGAWAVEGREKQLEYGLQAIEPALAGPVIGQLIEAGKIRLDGSGPWIELVGKAGTAKELRSLFDLVLDGKLDAAAKIRTLTALDQAMRLRKIKPSGSLQGLANMIKDSNESVRVPALKLAGAWRQNELANSVLALAADKGSSPAVQQAAFDSAREMGGEEILKKLQALAGKESPIETRRRAVLALASLDLNKAMPLVLSVLTDTTDEGEALALWRSLLANRGAAAAFVKALPTSGLPATAAKAGMRAAREGGRKEPELVLAIAQSGNLEDSARDLTAAEMQAMVTTIKEKGDPVRGEKIYRRAELGCVACHAIGGVGGKVGPDLTSIGASAPADYLIESLLYPNRKVKEGYHSVMIETKDGLEISGVPVKDTSDQIIVRDAANREVAVAKNNIQKQSIGGSIMPSGLLENISSDEQLDLYRFLSELGKPGPYDASKGSVARLWRLLPETIDIAQFGPEKVVNGSLDSNGWSPAYSYVDGRLSKDELKAKLASIAYRDPASIYAAARFEVPKSGSVRLKFTGAQPQGIWIDGKQVSGPMEITADLPAGSHTFIVKLDAKNLPDQIRLETNDGTFSTN